MSDTTSKVAANLRAFRIAVAAHDRENPEPHSPAFGIGMSRHDMDRLGFDEAEELWPGISVHMDDGVSGNFRVLCQGEHDEGAELEEAEAIGRAIGLPVGAPGDGFAR